MAAAVNFSGHLPRQSICYKGTAGLSFSSTTFKRSPQQLIQKQKQLKIRQRGICVRKQPGNKSFDERRLNVVMSAVDDIDSVLGPSPSIMIKQFYTCINERKLKELDDYISDDCCVDDCSFPYPIQGKKEVMRFFQQLTAGMGQNVKFSVQHVCDDDDESTAGVNWHLEWKRTPIPFTRGCSFYECSQKGDRLVIKKALVLIESPIKPGGMALTLLKNMTAIFDDFPKAAEWFLKSPHVIAKFCFKIYGRLLAPIINPLLAGYIRMWNFIARLVAFSLNMVLHILKKYFG